MRIGIIGCGYVADHYLRTLERHPDLELAGVTDLNAIRAEAVARRYGTRVYKSNEALLGDPKVELIINLTNVDSHYRVTKACLLAGKHVYSEKPLTRDLLQARELVDLAAQEGLLLSAAPCNVLSDTVQTIWKAVLDGAVGKVRLVYAELDDNPVYLMKPEGWASASGAPWPYREEYEQGCTIEHAGYHLAWMCAIFGPAVSLTAFSSCLVPDKTSTPLNPTDSPDFSVACIFFQSGVVARLTCSIVAPMNHRVAIIGSEGVITTDTYRHYRSTVHLERFTQLSLNARKARSVRRSPILQQICGIGGKKLVLVGERALPRRRQYHDYFGSRPPVIGAILRNVRARELGIQDKLLGAVEMAEALRENRRCLLPPDFVMHVTELTLAIADSRRRSCSTKIQTTFEPLSPKRSTMKCARNYRPVEREAVLHKLITRFIERAHRHK